MVGVGRVDREAGAPGAGQRWGGALLHPRRPAVRRSQHADTEVGVGVAVRLTRPDVDAVLVGGAAVGDRDRSARQ